MQPASNTQPSAIQVPKIDTNEPVAVIPLASVAALEGPPDGQRINTFAVAPKKSDSPLADLAGKARERVLRKPLTHVAAAFSLGFVVARALR
jgi:hypothetical protein